MRNYELIVMYSPELSSEDIDSQKSEVKEVLTKNGAKDISAEDWGKRRSAYILNKKDTAHYVCYNYQSEEAKTTSDSTAALRLNEKILKFQFHRLDQKTRKFAGNPKRGKVAAAV